MKTDTKKSNLILIGMPGCGKSTCGVLAAKALCKSFIDTDLLIQQREGCLLQEILDTRGSEYFSHAESWVLKELEAETDSITFKMTSAITSAIFLQVFQTQYGIFFYGLSEPCKTESYLPGSCTHK